MVEKNTLESEKMKRTEYNLPWLDIRITKEAMDELWDTINNSPLKTDGTNDARFNLAGNISSSLYMPKNKGLFEDTIIGYSEYMYYGASWGNYYGTKVEKVLPAPVFTIKQLWVNYQKQHEFNPPHDHDGLYSFVVFMKIPTHWKEQHALPISVNSNAPCAGDFMFLVADGQGQGVNPFPVPLSPEDEGRMLFFPSWLKHQVFPFYGTEEERITVSGNVIPKAEEEEGERWKGDYDKQLEEMEKAVKSLKLNMKRKRITGKI